MAAARARAGRCVLLPLVVLVALCVPALSAVPIAAARSRAQATGAACLVPGLGRSLDRIWRPDIASAIAYRRRRRGDVAFAVRPAGAF